MWSLTEDRSSPQSFGESSAPSSGPRPACHPGSIRNLTARRRGRTRRWRWLSGAWSPVTPRPGRSSCCGLNTPTTHSSAPPLASPHSSALMDTSHPCSQPRRGRSLALLYRLSSADVAAPGPGSGPLSCGRWAVTQRRPTADAPPHPPTKWDRRCGCQPGTYRSGSTRRNLHPSSSVPLKFRRSSTLLQSASSFPGLCESTPHSTSRKSSQLWRAP